MVSHFHHKEQGGAMSYETRGYVWNWARSYDLLMRFVTLGREQTFRQRIVDLAQLQPGEKVLDVGCGTGTLAMVALQRVGATGGVSGIDPSVQMIARANHKATRRGLSLDFQVGVIERLAFPDQSFDVVLSTFMMHQLPDDLKRQGLVEIARVLKPGGRLLVVDTRRPGEQQGRSARLVHTGRWNSGIQDQPALMKEAGFSQIETGEMETGESRLPEIGFALGRKILAEAESAGL